MIVPPDAELQRGKIYFLMPAPTAPDKTRSSKKKKKRSSSLSELPSENIANSNNVSSNSVNNNSLSMSNFLISDRYLSDILHEKIATQRDRRRGRVGVWRPHLESISESPTDL
ncbi:PADRE domain [Dillenia turbinata]